MLYGLADAVFIDRVFGVPLNAYRAKLGLAPMSGVFKQWCHSPQCTIGLFPDWFAAPQPDWPKQTVLTGFPLFERAERPLPLSPELEAFLREGSKPIVFTPGSAMVHGHSFFIAAAQACKILGRRGVLLTRHAEQIPSHLPEGVIHVPYAPVSASILLPLSAALVHHAGGIGSTAQAMACGVPQLMMPMGFDQPDNARRIQNLGVGDELAPKQFTADAVARKLEGLLTSASVAAACRASGAQNSRPGRIRWH